MDQKKASRDFSMILLDPQFRKTPNCSYYNDRCSNHATLPSYAPPCTSIAEFENVMRNGFQSPILVDKCLDLGMKVVPITTTLYEISEWIGPNTVINIMEVGSQSEITGWTFGDYVEYLNKRTKDHKIVNLISLEFSKTRLAGKVEAPSIVRRIDWINGK